MVVVDAEPAPHIRWTAHAAEAWGRSHRMVQVGGRVFMFYPQKIKQKRRAEGGRESDLSC
eukprot:COSAG01_NODE_768_length_13739_cov_6.271334_26_plen_60_part_00